MYYFPLLIEMQLGKSMHVNKRTDLRFSVINRMNTPKGKGMLIYLLRVNLCNLSCYKFPEF